MASQADRITGGDLTDRVATHNPRTGVGRLGTALNGMLARIETSQQQMRRFFGDASHELRTPLASLRAQAAGWPSPRRSHPRTVAPRRPRR
jgi:two-component system, OmpR family, sensor kinase